MPFSTVGLLLGQGIILCVYSSLYLIVRIGTSLLRILPICLCVSLFEAIKFSTKFRLKPISFLLHNVKYILELMNIINHLMYVENVK